MRSLEVLEHPGPWKQALSNFPPRNGLATSLLSIVSVLEGHALESHSSATRQTQPLTLSCITSGDAQWPIHTPLSSFSCHTTRTNTISLVAAKEAPSCAFMRPPCRLATSLNQQLMFTTDLHMGTHIPAGFLRSYIGSLA